MPKSMDDTHFFRDGIGRLSFVSLLWLFSLGIALVLPSAKAADEVRHRFITIGTGSPAGVYFAAGRAICEAVNRLAEQRAAEGEKIVTSCRAGPSGGSAFNIRQVATGAFTFVIAQANDQRAAVEGTDPERIQKVPGLRAVLSLQPEMLHIVVPRQSDIQRVEDFTERRISAGNRGSGTRIVAQALIQGHGLTFDDFESIDSLTIDKQSKELCAGTIDAFVIVSAIPAGNVLEAVSSCGAQLLPLDGPATEALIAGSSDLVNAEVPADTYPDIASPVPTLGVRAGLVTRSIVPDDVVDDVLTAIMNDLHLIRATHPSLATLDPRVMATVGHGAPLHKAAAAYFAERGWR